MCLRTFSMSSTRSHVVFSFSSAGGNDSPDPRWSTRTMPVCGDIAERGLSLASGLREESGGRSVRTDGTPPDRSAARPFRHIHLPDHRAQTKPVGPARVDEGERCQFSPKVGGTRNALERVCKASHILVPVLPDVDLVQIRHGEVLRLVGLRGQEFRCKRGSDPQQPQSQMAAEHGAYLDRREEGDHSVLLTQPCEQEESERELETRRDRSHPTRPRR